MMKQKRKIILVVGARPNFMKIAPLMYALEGNENWETILVHTGQHYDEKMSGQFFKELDIRMPDINLNIGSCSHAQQTARIMMGFEEVCIQKNPDFVLVVGDVNSTAACTLVASKMGIKTIHYEAGLRSNDRTMPEEINRLVTDAISDYFITTSDDASINLLKENVPDDKIFMLGNLMIDTLVKQLPLAEKEELDFQLLNRSGRITIGKHFENKNYGVLTFHRPSNVDSFENLSELIGTVGKLSQMLPLIFPIHPRTYKNIVTLGLKDILKEYENLYIIEPLGYLQFIHLVRRSKFVVTDSGGIQEETTYLKIPCLTVRPNTERPITILVGSNKLIKLGQIEKEVTEILEGRAKKGNIPKFWDGKTAERIVETLDLLK